MENYHAIPPVAFSDLLKQQLPKDLQREIAQLLEIKEKSGEKDWNPKLPAVQAYIEQEILRYGEMAKGMADDRVEDREPLDQVFRKVLTEI